MSESVKVKEIEMELKPYETMCEQTTEYLRSLICGSEEADAQTILSVAKTLGEITDVKKDIVEMCYKKQIVEAMEGKEDEYGETWDEDGLIDGRRYYPRPRDSRGRFVRRGYRDYRMMPDMDRDMDLTMGRMYYDGLGGRTDTMNSGRGNANGTISGTRNYGMYDDKADNLMYYGNGTGNSNMRDYREGRSGMSRRGYMESKEQHKSNSPEDKQKKMLELEKYVDDLSNDVKEMIMDSTPEEKSMLKQKLMGMANNL